MERSNHFDVLETALNTFLMDGGLELENVKKATVGDNGNREVICHFSVLQNYSYIIRLYEVCDDEGRFLPFLAAEIALGKVPMTSAMGAYSALLEWNREIPSGVKTCLTGNGLCCVSFRQRVDLLNQHYIKSQIRELIDHAENISEKLQEFGLVSVKEQNDESAAVSQIN